MASSTFRQIDSGATFEIYEGPTVLMRMDWAVTSGYAVRLTYVGHIATECSQPIIRRYEAMMRAKQTPFAVFNDGWAATGYETGMRVAMVTWTQKNPNATKELHFLTQSKLMNMGIAVMNLALGGMMKAYSKRQDFDVLCKRAGLPLNPQMPEFSPSLPAGAAR